EVKGGMILGNDLDYTAAEGQPPGTVSSASRAMYLLHYLGDSMVGTTSPGVVQPIQAVQYPWDTPSATFLYNARPVAGQTTPSPWVTRDFNIVSNPREDIVGTSRGSYLARDITEITSTAVTAQSYWFDSTIVTTFGWREDDVETFSAGAEIGRAHV